MERYIVKNEVKPRKRQSISLKKSQAASCQKFLMNGVQIMLPPEINLYLSQKQMMVKVLLALKQELNALIESPTGSGKTMGLLASTAAWLVDYNEKRQEQRKLCPKHGLGDVINDSVVADVKSESPEAKKSRNGGIKQENGKVFKEGVHTSSSGSISSEMKEELDESLLNDMEALSQSMYPEEDENTMDGEDKDGCTCPPRVRVYYCTRTHKQISQVVKEYSRLPYAYLHKIRHTILASRQQTCVNEEVRKKEGDLNKNCRDLIKGQRSGKDKGCPYREPLSKKFERSGTLRYELERISVDEAWDIEMITDELKKWNKSGMCPYFATTRYLTTDADFVFCPFNYLLDPIIRTSSDVHLKNSIVILDEAHNIEDVCRDSASFNFTETEFVSTIHDFKLKIQKIRENKDYIMTVMNDELAASYLNSLEDAMVEMDGFLKWFYTIFTDLVNRAKANRTSFVQPVSLNLDWGATFQKFGKIAEPAFKDELKNLMKAFEVIAGKGADSSQSTTGVDLSTLLPISVSVICVEKILYFLYFYQKDKNRTYYKCNVTIENARARRDEYSEHLQDITVSYLVPGCHVSINLWCMLPAVCATDAFAPCRSVILASGTLHPIDSFSTELGMDFRFQMEGDQLIPKEQIFATGLPWGPTNKVLKLTYKEMENDPGIKTELARLVLDVCRVVPNGVLVFCASYRMLEDLRYQLDRSGMMKELQEIKDVFFEPKNSMDMQGIQQSFEYSATRPMNRKTGALMIAVFRGKVSEGIDFADDKARCVISIGIPFPNLKDEQVNQKKHFNDYNSKTMSLLSGSEWYSMQAFRALNQALGRCLRHKNDWGALILVDERFQYPQPKISKWVRERMVKYNVYQGFKEALAKFVSHHTGREVKTEVMNPVKAENLEPVRKGYKASFESDSIYSTPDSKYGIKKEANDGYTPYSESNLYAGKKSLGGKSRSTLFK